MLKKIKYGKILTVVFITVLIWVWADMVKTETHPVSGAAISAAESVSPNLWVTFADESSVSIDKMVLKGPTSKIDEIKRKLREGRPVLKFFLDPEQTAMTEPGEYTLDVLDFLKKNDRIKRLGLTVESCQPQTIPVSISMLVRKSLRVRCVDEDEIPIKDAIAEPVQVDMFVPEDWEGEKRIATIRLTAREIDHARLMPIEKTPCIELPGGHRREIPITVNITMPSEESQLADYLITATLGIAVSPTLQGKYKVEVTNLDAVMSAIPIRATPDAKRAYELQPYPPMTLYVFDDDKKTAGEQRREVIYNFPEEFVRSGEIKLKGQPVEARFKLTPLPAGQTP